jgi:DNA polymerase III alpha subunit
MLKMDFLALTTLTIIDDCLKSIERETGAKVDLTKIRLTTGARCNCLPKARPRRFSV